MPATIRAVKQTLIAASLFVTFVPASHITVFNNQLPIKVQGRAVIGLLLRRQFDRINDRPSPGGQLLVASAACQWATAAGAEEPNTEVTGTGTGNSGRSKHCQCHCGHCAATTLEVRSEPSSSRPQVEFKKKYARGRPRAGTCALGSVRVSQRPCCESGPSSRSEPTKDPTRFGMSESSSSPCAVMRQLRPEDGKSE
jgi:hypothetical protein